MYQYSAATLYYSIYVATTNFRVIAGLLPETFKPEFIEDKNSGQNPGVSFPLRSYSIVVDIPEILNNFNSLQCDGL